MRLVTLWIQERVTVAAYPATMGVFGVALSSRFCQQVDAGVGGLVRGAGMTVLRGRGAA
ncbi:hypothetical protein QQY66_23095 [Streptomyces sp. DG2A-72]|uniref:hypothetical protein n=1 Tax=Streptomyces sp. DG2A-72 TaxID=3051386 RepID=UPI00265BAA08|nr:hypothetical protein [Streptomyces sp. DG2A-72]MDO0934422.1 hypothetical protein [Streptomyces sp. DG2A-72]